MMLTYALKIVVAPFDSQRLVARRAKPAPNGAVGQELVAPLCAIQIGRAGYKMSSELCEDAHIQVNYD